MEAVLDYQLIDALAHLIRAVATLIVTLRKHQNKR
jgi:hypothetical protein